MVRFRVGVRVRHSSLIIRVRVGKALCQWEVPTKIANQTFVCAIMYIKCNRPV